MTLVDRGKLSLADKVAKYIPAFAANGKESITVEQLLLHRSGLVRTTRCPIMPTVRDSLGANLESEAAYPPGTDFRYSDMGYIVLGELVKVVDGRPIDEFSREEVFQPLGMRTPLLPAGNAVVPLRSHGEA